VQASLASSSTFGEVDGGAARDGGVDHGAARDGARVWRHRGGRVRCYDEQPCAATQEKTSSFFGYMEVEWRCALKQQKECGCGRPEGRTLTSYRY
jgi:hypothetical protein